MHLEQNKTISLTSSSYQNDLSNTRHDTMAILYEQYEQIGDKHRESDKQV
jgi:hypothetical protein